MHEPSVRGSKLAIAAGVAATLVVGGTGFLLGRKTAPVQKVQVAAPAAPAQKPQPVATEPAATLERAELVELAAMAADAAASGTPPPEKLLKANGRRFDLVLPFGCSGPVSDGTSGAMGWQVDPQTNALRVFARPQSWAAADWNLPEPANGNGFWIARPWSSSTQCPERSASPVADGTEAITLPGQTLAIAQFGAQKGAWRTFEKVERQEDGQSLAEGGFRLRLRGKLTALEGGVPFRCVQPGGQEQRPICVISARIEDVRIEDGLSGNVIATWDERSLR